MSKINTYFIQAELVGTAQLMVLVGLRATANNDDTKDLIDHYAFLPTGN